MVPAGVASRRTLLMSSEKQLLSVTVLRIPLVQ